MLSFLAPSSYGPEASSDDRGSDSCKGSILLTLRYLRQPSPILVSSLLNCRQAADRMLLIRGTYRSLTPLWPQVGPIESKIYPLSHLRVKFK